MKFLFVTFEALSADLAWQLKKEGHEVKFYCHDQPEKDVGDGFVEKVEQWEPLKDWADVIVMDDVGFGSKADQLRSEGKKVVGGSAFTDKLELDREFGQAELKAAGVNILPSWNFDDFDKAIALVKEKPDRYVIKPSGKAQSEKELLFAGQDEDGKDVLSVLEHYKANWSKKIKEFQIQTFAEGVEVAVGAFFNGKDFVYPINTNFEHKRLFPSEIGPSTGEMGCYDDKTEVLSKAGWKLFKDLKEDDEICTLSPKTGEIEYQSPVALVSFSHHKKLVSIKNRALDIMVTLDHNMYVESQQDAKTGRNFFKFVKARDLESQCVIPRTGRWTGVEQETFVLPSVEIGHYEGRQVVLSQSGELEIPMDRWLAFFGIWLADGHVAIESGNYQLGIAQKTGVKTEKIRKLLSSLPFAFSEGGQSFSISSKQLWSYLRQFGGARDKFVPDLVKGLCPRQIRIFLDWFALGDGTEMTNGFRIFYTSSRRLADDLQELLLKIGRVGLVKRRLGGKPRWIVNHYADASRPQYEVIERVRKLKSWIDRRDTRVVDYAGRVYCATVKNHVMYVRRNGKPYWCGNTSIYWTRNNPIFEATLLKAKDKLAANKYVGYVDVNCIANSKGIWPLEWTCFDEETEILTNSGWKKSGEIVIGDYALSMNPSNRELGWKRIVNKIERRYTGKMIAFGASEKSHTAIEALVTPEHKMLIGRKESLTFARADSIPLHGTKVIRTGRFKGEEVESITIPGYTETHYLGREGAAIQIEHPPVEVAAKNFMSFLGLYLAEGSLGGRPHFVTIAQSPHSERRLQIRRILDNCGFRYSEEVDGAFQLSSTQLVKFIQALGLGETGASGKFVPSAYKNLNTECLDALVQAFALGDGNRHRRTGQLTMGTTSKRLADDLQELIIKCGKVANIRVQRLKGTLGIGGYQRNSDLYVLSLREKKMDYSLDKRVIRTHAYRGLIWDVEVEEWHTMLVRRRGKPFFSGNCRFGYPTISIQMEGITSEWGTFLADLAAGKDAQLRAKKGYQVGVVVCIPPWPFEDEKAFRKYSEGATILFRRQSRDGVHIGEVKQENGDWHIAGRSGYALVVTGAGATMPDAIKEAYGNVKNVMIPNMFFRNDIGQRWARDSDMLLSWGYL